MKTTPQTILACMLCWAGLLPQAMANEPYVGYLYAYFSGDESRLDDQQIYFAVSKDGITWDDLNENNPVLVSTLGDKSVRDPYIIRSVDGSKFFLIATDLDIRAPKYGGNWGLMATEGSQAIMIWESADLINWSAQRMVTVSNSIGAGNTWAPEAIWDDRIGAYLVYWSSRVNSDNFAKHRIYVSKTQDFTTFSQPHVFIETEKSCIDASIFKSGDTYYRLLKDESSLNVYLSKTTQLIDSTLTAGYGNGHLYVPNTELESYKGGYEGATMFQFIHENRWCVLVDEYTGSRRGYIPFLSTDIAAPNSLHLMADGTYLMPTGAKHGTVIPITQTQYDKLVNKWGIRALEEAPSATPVLRYDFNQAASGSVVVDQSGNGHNATLYGNATVVNDAVKGQVLYLDGSTNTYLAFPQGFFDGRSQMTLSMDLKPESDALHHFTLAIGLNNKKYLFLRTRPGEIRTAITTLSYGKEGDVLTTGSFKSRWQNIKIVMDGHKMALYLDNVLVDSTGYVRSIGDLGSNLLAYLGKSFYNDPYFKGYYDNVVVYNRALTHQEITTDLQRQTTNTLPVVSPQPFSHVLELTWSNLSSTAREVTLYDAGGRLLRREKTTQPNVTFNTTNLPSGLYQLCVLENGERVVKAVLKQD